MYVSKLVICNVCQFTYTEVEFGTGINGVLGRNGSGKTNLLNAIVAALTNEWGTIGNKKENISQYAKKGEAAYIELHGQHGELSFVIRRGLAHCISGMRLSDGREISGDDPVTTEISRMTGLSAKALKELIIVPQGDLFLRWRETKASVRMERWHQLFGFTWAAACYKLLGEKAASVVIQTPVTSSDQLFSDSNKSRQAKRSAEHALLEFDDLDSYDMATDPNLRPIRRAKLYRSKYNEVHRQYSELERKRQERDNLSQRIEADRLRLEEADAYVRDNAEQAAVADERISQWDRYQTRLADYRYALDAYNSTSAALQSLVAPLPPTGITETADELLQQLGVLSDDIKKDHEFLSDPLASQRTCPTCKRPFDSLHEHDWAAAKDRLDSNSRLRDELRGKLNAVRTYAAALADYESTKAKLSQRLSSIVVPDAPMTHLTQDLANEAKEISYVYRERQQLAIRLRTNDFVKASAALSELAGAVDLLTSQQDVLRQDALKYVVTPEAYSDAIEYMRQQAFRITQRASLRASADEHKRNAEFIFAQAQNALRQEQDAAKKMQWKTDLLSAQAILHRDNLPKKASYQKLLDVVAETNSLLARQNVDFSISADEDLTVTAHFRDGREQPVWRLSGGQMVRMALNVVIATNSAISGVQFVCLDEPTEFQDTVAKAALTDTLNRMKELTQSAGLQCIIVTHEKSLQSSFDRTIVFNGIGQPEVQ